MKMNPLMARFADEPTLVNPGNLARFESCLAMASAEMDRHAADFAADRADVDSDWWGEPDSFRSMARPYVVQNGILQIPVKGVLLHDFPWALGGWATGYDYIWRAFQRGMSDPNVQGIALICDTPGGQVAGCFDCVDRMFALKNTVKKPVRGYAAEGAYSAGFAVISVCDTVTVSRTGGVGSVGVVTSHMDVSGAMAEAGLKITFIYAGKHKVDGNAYQALPDDVKARIQARIDETYEVFVSTVARNRPVLSADDVRASEALCFTASQALENKFADSIGALDDALADYAADLCEPEGEDDMSTVAQAEHDAAVTAARTEGHAAGRAEGHTAGLADGQAAGATAERTRISAILDSAEGKDRPAAALAMALDEAALPADSASKILAKLPKETAPAAAAPGATGFAAAMEQTDNPNLGSGAGSKPADDAASAEPVLNLVHAAGIGGFKSPSTAH